MVMSYCEAEYVLLLLCLGLTVLLYSVKQSSVLFHDKNAKDQPFHASLNYFFPQFENNWPPKQMLYTRMIFVSHTTSGNFKVYVSAHRINHKIALVWKGF